MSSGLLESSERPVAVGRQIVDARALRQTLIELSRVPDAVALCGDLVETACPTAARWRPWGRGAEWKMCLSVGRWSLAGTNGRADVAALDRTQVRAAITCCDVVVVARLNLAKNTVPTTRYRETRHTCRIPQWWWALSTRGFGPTFTRLRGLRPEALGGKPSQCSLISAAVIGSIFFLETSMPLAFRSNARML